MIGESILVDKKVDDFVFVGIINELGIFEFKVIVVVNNMMLVCIIYVVEEV